MSELRVESRSSKPRDFQRLRIFYQGEIAGGLTLISEHISLIHPHVQNNPQFKELPSDLLQHVSSDTGEDCCWILEKHWAKLTSVIALWESLPAHFRDSRKKQVLFLVWRNILSQTSVAQHFRWLLCVILLNCPSVCIMTRTGHEGWGMLQVEHWALLPDNKGFSAKYFIIFCNTWYNIYH